MAKGTFDGEVEDNYKPIPAGEYKGHAEKVEFKMSKNGNEMIQIEFILNDNKRHFWKNIMWFNDTVMNIAKSTLEQLGFTREERKELDPDDHDSFLSAIRYMVTGKVYDIKIGFNKDGDNEIKYISDPNAIEEADPLDQTLDAPMKGKKPRIQSPWG